MTLEDTCPIAIRFKRRFDVELLRNDLDSAQQMSPWIDKPERGKYFGWSAIALIALHGKTDLAAVDEHVPPSNAALATPTPVLGRCPYIQEILALWSAPKTRVRFMRLVAGGLIGRHRDPAYGLQSSAIRLHIPVVTGPDVKFMLQDTRLRLRSGELWYLNTTREHEVHNAGNEDRVHLVIDILNTEQTRRELNFLGRDWELAG